MSHVHVTSRAEAEPLLSALATANRFALDCEAAGFHRYSDRLCLVQLTVADETYVIDPFEVDVAALLKGPIEDPDQAVVMHGADFDLRLLSRDLGIRLRGLVDTQVSAALIGEEGLGLASLLESRFGIVLSKKYQRADWAKRPLEEAMLEYAADDTRHLVRLSDALARDLDRLGRGAWAEEECRALEAISDEDHTAADDVDPVTRVKGARDLSPRHVTALREALLWRDELARARDRAPFRVVGDKPLLEAVARKPDGVEGLKDVPGFPKGLARNEGRELLRRLAAVARMPEEALVPYPRAETRGLGRPPPEVEARFQRLKVIRNRVADELELPRGTLLANAVLVDIARAEPRNRAELLRVEGMRQWKADVVGEELLSEVARG